eukprot:Nitzschia sp. Nitz4//scaffold37_size175936//153285//154416//NITZ4_002065-RA/size175936-augustus-gene-0.11-mRNA-1//1//CDS//3329549845//523//frame0
MVSSRLPVLLLFTCLLQATASKLTSSRSLQDYSLRAFLCNENLEKSSADEPFEDGDLVRVCLEPTTNSANYGVSVLKINTFSFYKANAVEEGKTIRQKAIDSGLAEDTTTLDCPGGPDGYCYFQTLLRSDFFLNDGTVEGVGSVAIQQEDDDTDDDTGRRLRGSDERRLQDFIGMVGVTLSFDVDNGVYSLPKEATNSIKDHWDEISVGVKALYILGVLVMLMLCCCFCSGLILWRKCCADIPGVWIQRERDDDDVDVEKPHTQDDPSETYSLDDDDILNAADLDDDDDAVTVGSQVDVIAPTTTSPEIKRLEYDTSYEYFHNNVSDERAIVLRENSRRL